jgi:hypothetical protein
MNIPHSPIARLALALTLSASLSLGAGRVLAEVECQDPVASWKPREVLRKLLEDKGWVVHRIRIDDGCYQVRALDDQGRSVEATYAPASLTLMELELEDDEHERREHRDAQHPSR